MLSPSQQHIHDYTDGKDVNARRIAPLLDQLWTHEDECADLVSVIVHSLVLVLRTEAKVGHF